jgi:hypothetical protein
MRRRLALIPILLLLSLAGCDGRTEGIVGAAPTAEATTAPTVAAAPTSTTVTRTADRPSPTVTKVSDVSKARLSGSGDSRWGTQYAFLRSSKLSTRQITYDLIEWYDGEEAVRACAKDHVKPAENDYCASWYIRNHNKRLRTLTVYPDAPIRMTRTPTRRSVTH